MVFIFDLDQTLVDSRSVEHHRNKRDWTGASKAIDSGLVQEYEGVSNLLNQLILVKKRTAIVTSSPSIYANRIIKKFDWSFNTTVCFHDTQLRKPNPDPILKALSNLGVPTIKFKQVYSFGDRDVDIFASKQAGVTSVACLWGAENIPSLLRSDPDIVLERVSDIYKFIEIAT